VLEVSNQV
jgi:chromosome segregation ATPase